MSADVALSNVSTGASFGVDGELVVTDRTAAGKGELQFDANASGSLHTWAVWALDANGMPLSEKPEIIDVLFGNDEDGAIVARADGSSLIKTLRVKNRTAPGTAPEDGTHTVRVVVRDTGIHAAYLGIQELASDGVALSTHVDLEAMTADVYATFQGKMFDALVPLDTWTAVVEGRVDVTGLAISTGGIVEEGAELDWDIQFFAAKTAEKPALDATYLLGTRSYAQKFKKLKSKGEKGFEAFRVPRDELRVSRPSRATGGAGLRRIPHDGRGDPAPPRSAAAARVDGLRTGGDTLQRWHLPPAPGPAARLPPTR